MHKTSFVLAAFLVTSAFAETAIPCRGGTLAFERLAVEFSPSVVYCGWKGRAKVVPVDAVDFAFALEKPKANVNGTLLTQPRDGGKLEATWRFRPDRDIYVEELNAFANLPTAIYAGGWVEVDGARKELSREEGKNFNGRVRGLMFHDANGDETFTVEFPKGQEVSIVDCRPYRCPWFDLRLQGGRRHAANEAAVVTAVFSLPKGECFRLSGTGPVTMTPGAEWLPVARAKAIAPGSAADFTAMATAVSGVPAGKWGYPVVRDGHVEFERRPGVEQRFYGVNICYQAIFPEPDEAERLATMLVAFRLTEFDYVDTHYYWDHPCAADPGGSLWGVPQRLQHGTSPLRYCRGYRSGPRLAGQPFTVTEFNYCNPGRYRACSALLVGALSAQGDWSGAWRFDWGCSKGGIGEPWRQEAGRFQVGGDPVVLAGERLATALFLRGDLVPSKGRTFGTGDGVVVNEAAGSLTVATDRACGGFVEKGGFEAGALRVDVGLDASCVGVISLSREAIRTSRRLLLLHLTDGVAGGSRFRDARRNVIENNGSRDVHLLRAGTAKVSLALASGVWRVWALDATGARRRRLPAVFAAGRLEFEITTGCRTGDATYQYEIALD